jgi:hypothetical protein
MPVTNPSANDISKQAKQATQTGNDVLKKILEAFNQKSQLSESAAESVKKGAEADIVREQTARQGKLDLQQVVENIANLFGTNTEDPSSRIGTLAQQVQQNFDKANATLDQIHQAESVGFLDNPIQYLVNQFELPDLYQQYNYHAEKHNLAKAEAISLNDLSQESIQTAQLLEKSETAESVAAIADSIRAKAEIAAVEHKLRAISANIEGLTAINQQSQQALDNSYKAYTAQNAAAHLALAEKELDLRLKDKKQTEDDYKFIAQAVSVGAGLVDSKLAGKVYSPTEIRRMRDFGSQEQRELLSKFYAVGSAHLATGSRSIGSSPGEVAVFSAKHNADLGAGQTILKDTFREAVGAVSAAHPELKNDQQIASTTDATLKVKLAEMAKNVEGSVTGYTHNVFVSAPVAEVADKIPAVKNSKLYTIVLDPLQQTLPEKKDFTAKDIMEATVAAVQSGKLKPAEASKELSTYYSNVVKYNNVVRDYASVGMKPQDTYKVTLGAIVPSVKSFFSLTGPSAYEYAKSPRNVDLTDETQVKEYFVKRMAAAGVK